MKYLNISLTVITLFITGIVTLILSFCKSSDNINEIPPELTITHLTQVNEADLLKRLESLNMKYLNIYRALEESKLGLAESREHWKSQRAEALKIIGTHQKKKAQLPQRIRKIDSLISEQKREFQKFKSRSLLQLEIIQLDREIRKIDRDILILRDPNTNEIELKAIETRYKRISQSIGLKIPQKSDKKKNPENYNQLLIDGLNIWKDTLNSHLNHYGSEIQGQIFSFQKSITRDSIRNDSLKKEILDSDNKIENTEKIINKLDEEFKQEFSEFKGKISFYRDQKYRLIAARITHEIALLFIKVSKIQESIPQTLHDDLNEATNLHSVLVEALFKHNYDLVEEQIYLIERIIKNLSWKLEDFEKLVEIVRNLFQDSIFREFLIIGTTNPETDPKFKNQIQAFNYSMLAIRRYLQFYPRHKIYIDGYADPLLFEGDSLYGNKKLSKERAESAKKRLKKAGVPDSSIIIDWFGEFHTQISLDSIGSKGSNLDRRIDLRVIGPTDTTEKTTKYLSFLNSCIIPIGDTIRAFSHRQGYWIENYQAESLLDTISIKYGCEVYKRLLNRHEIFREIVEPNESPIFESGTLRLGNEVQLALPITGKNYWIIIEENGAVSLKDPRVALIYNFLTN